MYETQQQIQISLPSPTKLFTPGVITILILIVAGIILPIFVRSFAAFFALGVDDILQGKIWQLVTYPFVDGPVNAVFSGLIVLFVGSAIEREWRTASFVLLWIVISVVCGLLWVGINLAIGSRYTGMGASGCTYGLIATMGLLCRGQRFFVFVAVVEAKYLVLILIAIGILLSINAPINFIWISGALVAYVYVKLRWNLASRRAGRNKAVKQSRHSSFVDVD